VSGESEKCAGEGRVSRQQQSAAPPSRPVRSERVEMYDGRAGPCIYETLTLHCSVPECELRNNIK
jgi:hypothetical protein